MSSLQGINGTIFMYGQTGAGKTHTMLGDYSADILQKATVQRPKTPVKVSKDNMVFQVDKPQPVRSQLSKSVLS
jgi:chromosomal replication initiation ATPase DnaA